MACLPSVCRPVCCCVWPGTAQRDYPLPQNRGCEAEDGCLGWLQVPRRMVTAEEPTEPTVDSPALLMTRAGTHPAHLSAQTVCGLPTVLGTRAPCTAASWVLPVKCCVVRLGNSSTSRSDFCHPGDLPDASESRSRAQRYQQVPPMVPADFTDPALHSLAH